MNMKKMAAALTAAAVIFGSTATAVVGNTTVMAAVTDSGSNSGESNTSSGDNGNSSEEITYTLKSVDATAEKADGALLPKQDIKLGSDGSTITLTVSQSSTIPTTSAIVSLTGIAASTTGTETVELTAEPVTVEVGNTSGEDYTLKSADGKVTFSGKVVVIEKKRPETTLSDVSAVVTDASGAVINSEVTVVNSQTIEITVPYDTPDGNVTVRLAAEKFTVKDENDEQTYINLKTDPVTVEIGSDRGTNYSLQGINVIDKGPKGGTRGKVFVYKAKAPETSDPETSDPETSDPETSDPDSSEPTSTPSDSTPSTSEPSTSTPSASTPAETDKEFKPALPDTGLDDETKRVLGGTTATDSDGAFGDGVVMNIKPGQTTSGFSFDIAFTKDGKEVQPKSSITVKVPVPEALKGKTIFVFHVENGKFVLITSEVKDGFVIFSADHFSEYVLSAENLADTGYAESSESVSAPESKPTAPENSNPSTGIAVAALPVLIAASAAAIIVTKKKK